MKRKKIEDWYQISNSFSEPELLIYGYIGPYDEVDFSSFQAAVKDIAKSHQRLTVRINSGGGSVFEGLSIYDCLVGSGLHITVIIEGMAASMAGVIAQAGHVRKINRNGFVMIHRVKGFNDGDVDDMRAYADLVEQCEARVKAIYASKTRQSAETVDSWYAKKVDWWLSPEEALALNIVDEIIDIGQVDPIEDIALADLDEYAAYNLISNSIKNQNTDMNKLQTAILACLAARGVSDVANATEDQLASAVNAEFKKLDGKIQKLENTISEQANQRVEDFVNAGKASGQIKDDEVEDWKELANANYDLAVKQLAKVPVTPKNVVVEVGVKTQSTDTKSDPENRDNWTFQDWSQKDSAGLAAMQVNEPEKFEKLVNGVKTNLVNKGAIK